MPNTDVRRSLLVLGITMVIAAPGLAIGSIWSRRQHIREFQEAALSPAVLADTGVRNSLVGHLSRYQAEDAMRWTLRGDGTWGAVGALAGLVLMVTALRRRTPSA